MHASHAKPTSADRYTGHAALERVKSDASLRQGALPESEAIKLWCLPGTCCTGAPLCTCHVYILEGDITHVLLKQPPSWQRLLGISNSCTAGLRACVLSSGSRHSHSSRCCTIAVVLHVLKCYKQPGMGCGATLHGLGCSSICSPCEPQSAGKGEGGREGGKGGERWCWHT